MYLQPSTAEFYDSSDDYRYRQIRLLANYHETDRYSATVIHALYVLHGIDGVIRGWIKARDQYAQYMVTRPDRYDVYWAKHAEATRMVHTFESEIEFYRFGELLPSGD